MADYLLAIDKVESMKVIDLETIEPEEVRQKIQNITDTVSRELRIYRARIRVEEGITENRYVLTFHFENNYNYSRVFTLNELLNDFGYFQWQTIGKGLIQEIKEVTNRMLLEHLKETEIAQGCLANGINTLFSVMSERK